MNEPLDDLAAIVRACPPAALAQLEQLYGQLDREAACLAGVCLGGGACCRFDLAGHRLYVTPLELAALIRRPAPVVAAPLRCPYQLGPRCQARDGRPLGCRVFFCQADAQAVAELYEHYHRLIRDLHSRHGVPYRYVELSAALSGLAP